MKYIFVFIAFLLIFSLVGCNNVNSPNGDGTTAITTEPETITTKRDSNELLVVHAMGYDLEISQEQSDAIKSIWNKLEWQYDITKTAYDYIFIEGERMIRYSYEYGIFNDVTNKKHTVLSEEIRAEVNDIIDHLIVLPIID